MARETVETKQDGASDSVFEEYPHGGQYSRQPPGNIPNHHPCFCMQGFDRSRLRVTSAVSLAEPIVYRLHRIVEAHTLFDGEGQGRGPDDR